jgi:hypothetical protein
MLAGCTLCYALFLQCANFSYADVIKTASGLVLGAYMLWENKRRERAQAAEGMTYDEHEGQRLSLLDRTEFVCATIWGAIHQADRRCRII